MYGLNDYNIETIIETYNKEYKRNNLKYFMNNNQLYFYCYVCIGITELIAPEDYYKVYKLERFEISKSNLYQDLINIRNNNEVGNILIDNLQKEIFETCYYGYPVMSYELCKYPRIDLYFPKPEINIKNWS